MKICLRCRGTHQVTVEEGDILLNITGDSVARCCRVPEAILPARVNQHVSIIRPNPEDFDSRFVGYFFISPFMQDTMLSLAGSGGTRKALTKEMIERFEVPQPLRTVQWCA
jgi:type I restriction enzyme S subunit